MAGITDEAKRVRLSDLPERFELRAFQIAPIGEEIDEECSWIYERLFLEREREFVRKGKSVAGKVLSSYKV